jgi:hypothetical protein
MNYKKSSAYFLLLSFAIIFSSCSGQSKDAAATQSKKEDTPAVKNEINIHDRTKPALGKMSLGKGSLSFKMDGVLYQTDPGHTKCWTTASVPLAMLMARGEGLSISWQMGYEEGKDSYHLDRDRTGTVNFTIGKKTYWTRSVMGDNYLDIKITNVKDKYSLKMLSGTFEGVLEDKDRNKVKITEGKFVTEDIGS